MIGHVLGDRYRLEHELDRCGMGIRYLASDLKTEDATVAVKVLWREVHSLPEAVARLRAEVRLIRMLRHPHIARVYSLHSDAGNSYLVTEYPGGRSLDAYLQETGQGMSLDDAVRVIDDLCAALAYAHDLDVVHGDVQPATVYVTLSGRAKLVDFGMVKAARMCNERFGALWVAGRTMAYASIDMLEGREPDPRDDVYSLACIVYTLLSGAHPFGSYSAADARRLGLAMPPLVALSRDQNAALARALAFERAQRTPGVSALLADLGWGLEQAVATMPVARAAADFTPAGGERAPERVPARLNALSMSPIAVTPPPAKGVVRYRKPAVITAALIAVGIGIALFYRVNGQSVANQAAAPLDPPRPAATAATEPQTPELADHGETMPRPEGPTAMTLAADPPTAADQNRVRAEHVDVPVRLLRPLPQAAAAMASNDNCPYPREAVDQGLTGTVVLAVFVATDGKPDKTRLDKSSGFAVLDEAAVRCVEQFARFPVPPGVVASGGYWGRMRFNWSFGS